MPARILVLFTTTALAATALTGCGSDTSLAAEAPSPPKVDAPAAADPPDGADAEAPKPAPAPAPAAAPKSGKSPAKDGTDLSACLDAECDVEVESGQEIQLDKKYGADSVLVKRNGSRVTLTVRRGGAKMVAALDANSPYSTSTFNDLTFQPRLAEGGKLVLNISHN
ncbi:hypothetical protein [Actinomadura macra]|uniref:hypothetical protein n=1 Tax=Actinomadura macra TaxID=46164 RepID=UPI000835AC31|nr:hypothetical protein [Actinomadura macra]